MKHPFECIENKLKGSYVITPFVSTDERGQFIKDYSQAIFEKQFSIERLAEVFYTHSKKGVLRGIHFQHTKEQAKLIRCISGKIFDVIVDLRVESPTFGKWQSFELSADTHQTLYIPKHFGHGYLVLEDSVVSYQCDEPFHAAYDDGIRWNDTTLNIAWPLHQVQELIISEKDRNLQTFEMFVHQQVNP